jgi:hypothetical protein
MNGERKKEDGCPMTNVKHDGEEWILANDQQR